MTKDTITLNEYRQLVGLLARAEYHQRHMKEIANAARELTGDEEEWGHTADAVYEPTRRDVSKLLDRLGIEVEDPE